MITTLTETNLRGICLELSATSPELGKIYDRYGTPPLWKREVCFETLIHIILEQQVSLASALSAFNRLREKLIVITPQKVLDLTDEELRDCYFSRQKTAYAKDLAKAVIEGKLVIEDLPLLSDDEVKSELKKIKGIGDWTADIFLLMALLRADIMPKGDLALHAAYQKLAGIQHRPGSDEFIELAKRWSPYRAVAARLLWHFYLSERKR